MKLHFFAGVLCAGMIAAGCGAEESTDTDIEGPDLEAQLFPKDPPCNSELNCCPERECCPEEEDYWTTTTTKATTKTAYKCSGWNLLGQVITCEKYYKCTTTDTWSNYCFCTDYGESGTLMCGKSLQSSSTACGGTLYSTCTTPMTGTSCWVP